MKHIAKAIAGLLLGCASTIAVADSNPGGGGYTSLQPTMTTTVVPSTVVSISGYSTDALCCCDGLSLSFPAHTIVVPGYTSTHIRKSG